MFNRHVHRQMAAYLDGELTPDQRRRFVRHVLLCRDCRRQLDNAVAVLQDLRTVPQVAAPETLWDEIEAAWVSRRPQTERSNGVWHALRACPPWAIAAGLLFLSLLGWWLQLSGEDGWRVTVVEPGSSRLDRIEVGQGFQTDDLSRAMIEVPEIGHVEIEPNTRVRLLRTSSAEHRMALDQGTLHARIWAPPRLFFVETPSALAIDYGCAYTLQVNDAGSGILRVTAGWVGLVRDGRESIVPAGALCRTEAGIGPGTPHFSDTSSALQQALFDFDFRQGGKPELDVILTEARSRDSLTLWHLLARVEPGWRGEIYDRLARLSSPPPSVTREGIIRLDESMLKAWWQAIQSSWPAHDPGLLKKKRRQLYP